MPTLLLQPQTHPHHSIAIILDITIHQCSTTFINCFSNVGIISGTPTENFETTWICPFYKSSMRDFGYDVANYCDVDPIFGTLDDFDRLLQSTHELNLKVIIDFVPNHTSSDHPWFVESRSSRTNPKRNWYIWKDVKPDGTPPNNPQSMFLRSLVCSIDAAVRAQGFDKIVQVLELWFDLSHSIYAATIAIQNMFSSFDRHVFTSAA